MFVKGDSLQKLKIRLYTKLVNKYEPDKIPKEFFR